MTSSLAENTDEEINKYRRYFGATNNTLTFYEFTLDRLKVKSSRSVYSFIDFLAEIGGLYGLLIIGA
jgi:hypothetical protein